MLGDLPKILCKPQTKILEQFFYLGQSIGTALPSIQQPRQHLFTKLEAEILLPS